MINPLHGLTVLVTRPSQQAQTLCQLIENQGGKTILLPTIAIADAADQIALQENIRLLAHNNLAIFVSPNAVQKSMPIIQQCWPTWPATVKIAAVGAGTVRALRDGRLPVDFYPTKHFNSEGLLALPALQQVTDQQIIIFCGEGGRELLATTLQQRGAKVVKAIAYQRTVPALAADAVLATQTANLIVCTSHTGLENLLTLVDEKTRSRLQSMPLLVGSERVAVLAKTLGFVKTPIVADNAGDLAIVNALVGYWKNIR